MLKFYKGTLNVEVIVIADDMEATVFIHLLVVCVMTCSVHSTDVQCRKAGWQSREQLGQPCKEAVAPRPLQNRV